LFNTETSVVSQLTDGRKKGLLVKALKTADMCCFLRIYPQLEILTMGIASALETRIRSAQESDQWASLCVGDIFLGLKPLASTYASYAAACEEATSILAQKEFTEYVNTISPGLLPLTLSQHLQAPFDALNRYQVQLQALLDETQPTHPDYEVSSFFRGVACSVYMCEIGIKCDETHITLRLTRMHPLPFPPLLACRHSSPSWS